MWKSKRSREKQMMIGSWKDTPSLGQKFTRDDIAKLILDVYGTVVLPTDSNYHACRQLTNFAFQNFPQLIVYCEVIGDVHRCLDFAHKFVLETAIRSGGHSTAGFSISDGMVIDLSRMNAVIVDAKAKRAVVGPGVQFGQLNAALDTYGLHVPGGACQDVCVAGYMQGGGYGLTSRQFGMNCDNVIEVLVMLADGGIVVANKIVNSDLFWALRGGTGGNFGIVLQITYELHSIGNLWGFGFQWSLVEHRDDIEHAAKVLARMQESFMRVGAPEELGYMSFLGWRREEPYLLMRGVFNGARDAALEVLAPLLAIAPNKMTMDRVASYYEIDKVLLDEEPGIPQVPDLAREDKQSGYIDRPLTAADWQNVLQHFLKTPNRSSLFAIEPYGGAISRIHVGANAFIHRNVDMDVYFDVFWMSEEERILAVAFLDDFMKLMEPYFNTHSYQNYPRLKQSDYRRRYWGEWFDPLLAVKYKYDKRNFFRYPQSISPDPQLSHAGAELSVIGLSQEIIYEDYASPTR
jgi:FAD/FMN-containing dehydrogenase